MISERLQEQRGAFDLLGLWLARDMPHRRVELMVRMDGCVTVELRSASGMHTSATQLTLESAIRTALMVAHYDGEV